jgi:hypothetical protein
MKAKELAKILLEHPEMEIEVGTYTYADFQDSVGAYEFNDIDTVSIRKQTKFRQAVLVLTGGKIGYPDNPDDFEVIT